MMSLNVETFHKRFHFVIPSPSTPRLCDKKPSESVRSTSPTLCAMTTEILEMLGDKIKKTNDRRVKTTREDVPKLALLQNGVRSRMGPRTRPWRRQNKDTGCSKRPKRQEANSKHGAAPLSYICAEERLELPRSNRETPQC